MTAARIGRNAPCPCGSGQRYKDCHGALKPSAMSFVWRALAQWKSRDYTGAEASFREAAQLAPDDARVHVDLATLCIAQHRHDDAEAPLLRALALEPEHVYALCLYTYIRQRHCAWDGLAALHERIAGILERGIDARYRFSPFALLSMPTTPGEQLIAARWAASMFAPPVAVPRPPVTLQPGERPRVGFVSSDFRDHPIAHLLIDYWERSDRSRVDTFAYGLLPRDTGPDGQRLERAFEHFVDVSSMTVEAIAQRIRDDRIGILIDLNGYTLHAREGIFALRPAPLQVSWLGYLGTLGASWYDYVLTDRFVVPPAQQAFFTERALYLPDCYCPSDTRRPVAPRTPDRAACGLPAEGVVLCCFNNSYKILPHLFDVWMRLLAALPGSVLWLAPGQARATVNLRREAQARGVDPARLVFAPRVSLPEHLARHVHADLFLDTTPYNAGTTANDALFMGVPVLTCAGDTMASRVAGSQLSAIGLPDLITTNLADYEALALRLARDATRLAQIRARLAANRLTTPLFDIERFTRALDDLLLATWENRPS